ncbi:hypothetical protein ABH968_004055 [Lysinibacillus sp. RC79]
MMLPEHFKKWKQEVRLGVTMPIDDYLDFSLSVYSHEK